MTAPRRRQPKKPHQRVKLTDDLLSLPPELEHLETEEGSRVIFGAEVRAQVSANQGEIWSADPLTRNLYPAEQVHTDHVSAREIIRAKRAVAALVERRMEALRLFEPLVKQEAFFSCRAPERLFIGGNRAAKTTPGAVETVRALTGCDPHHKWPAQKCQIIIVGKDLGHCGNPMWRKMAWAGQFRIIRDEITGEWRTWQHWREYDAAYKEKSIEAPPFLPPRMIKSVSWESKKDDIPKKVKLHNGSECNFYSSEALPRQGIEGDGMWFDEEILSGLWYSEGCPRLIDRNGLFYWTATPQAGTLELYDLAERAEKEQGQEEPSIVVFHASMLDNPYLTDQAKRRYLGKIRDRNEFAVRVEGKFALAGLRVYPEADFDGIHSCEPFVIPQNWSRYAAVDPGVQVCGVLFFAVAPPFDQVWAKKVIVYDELYIPRCDAKIFGERMRAKCQDAMFYSFVIDQRFGRQKGATGKSWAQHYAAALKDQRIACERTGHSFTWSSGDVDGGIEAVRKLLNVGPDGPTLYVMRDRAPMLCHEVDRYTYIKKPTGEVTDTPVRRKFHMMDCLRYGCETGLRYHRPKPGKAVLVGALQILERKKEKARIKRQGGSGASTGISLG